MVFYFVGWPTTRGAQGLLALVSVLRDHYWLVFGGLCGVLGYRSSQHSKPLPTVLS